jgi:hypothetical protein
MATPSRTCSALECKSEVPQSLASQRLCVDHYLEHAFQKLDQETENSRRGQDVNRGTLDWLLVQVDYIVETVGAEASELDPERHSKLLELLLAIANLNEYTRHQSMGVKQGVRHHQ